METNNPFPGLRPFEPGETHLFFGRDGQSEQIILRLGRTHFLAVVGTSGSGKSSLVRAGLLPALQGGLMASAGSGWRVAMFRPGHDPVGNLARTLASPEVFGAEGDVEEEMRAALTEATLRRSSLGLLEVVRQARGGAAGSAARLKPSENLLVVVDQFEELFRFRQLIEVENSKEDAAAFVRLLLEASAAAEEKIYVVLTMRSDFLGDCSQFQGLPEAINEGQYLIPRMNRDERRDAVTGPVAVGGGRITKPLVNQLLNDMGDNPDQLPILQHALMRTWDYWESVRRNGEPIDLPHYNAIGGMSEALSLHAEEAYGELGEGGAEQSARQRVAEKLFKALTEKGADNRETRRPLELRDACALAEADESEVVAVVETFRRPGRSFLMPPATVPLVSDSLIDISHESLIRNWTRLKAWTDEEAQSARTYKRLAETAVLHAAGQEALLKDPALQVALDWREKTKPNAAWARRYHTEFDTAMSFLDASVAAREAELKEREKQKRRDVSYKRTKLAALFLALTLLLALAAVGFSTYAMTKARESENKARESEGIALREREFARKELAQAQSERDKAKDETKIAELAEKNAEDAKAKAVNDQKKAEEAKAVAERQTEVALKREQQANAALEQAKRQSEYNAMVAAKNAAETKQAQQLLYPAVISLAQKSYESNDVERGRELLSLQTMREKPGFEWFYMNHLLHNEKETIETPAGSGNFVAASPDGKTLVVVSGSAMYFRDLKTGESKTVPIESGPEEDFRPSCMAISPDGKKLALGNATTDNPNVKLYDIETRKETGTLNVGTRSIGAIAFTADSKSVIAASGSLVRGHDSPAPFIKIWDVDTRALTDSLPASFGTIFAVSPDGKTVAVAVGDGVALWDLPSHKEVGRLTRANTGFMSLAFSPDGKSLAASTLGGTVSVWKVGVPEPVTEPKYEAPAYSLAYSPDGKLLAQGFEDGMVRICDAESLTDCAVLKGHREPVTSLSFSADGALLFSADREFVPGALAPTQSDATVKSWDVAAALREQLGVPNLENRDISVLAYSPDGKTLAAAGSESKVLLLDAETNRIIRTFYDDNLSVQAVAFSPDGRLLATADSDEVKLWNVSTGAQDGAPLGVKEANSLAFSRDGKLLVTASAYEGAVAAWDVATRKLVRANRESHDSANAGYAVSNLYLSPDGTKLVFTRNKSIEFWDSGLEKMLKRAELPLTGEAVITSLAHSADGRLIAVGDTYQRAVVLDADSLGVVNTVQIPKEKIEALALSPDGKTLATGNERGDWRLWSTTSFRELLTLKGDYSDALAAAFSPDGTKLVTLSEHGAMRVWYAPASYESFDDASRSGTK
jgi:WD40 repeat protein